MPPLQGFDFLCTLFHYKGVIPSGFNFELSFLNILRFVG